ncbi:hypothetical protein R5R35_012571 [Gryllus longicercus]|uniref:Uncharacterized protein n=1 Tax=Gryllus longicercus TaxID=2509291 RepID=A0AAN9Z747_9ORTH
MSSYSQKFCYCDVKVAALSVAIYKVLFTLASLIASAVGAYVYSETPEDPDPTNARINRVIGGALIALTVFCFLLLVLNTLLLWAVIKRKIGFIKWWIRLTVVIEVVICSTMFMGKYWDTLRSFCLILNFALNIFIIKAICAYERWLVSETNGELLKNTESESHHESHKRLSSESLNTSQMRESVTIHEEKTSDEAGQ